MNTMTFIECLIAVAAALSSNPNYTERFQVYEEAIARDAYSVCVALDEKYNEEEHDG